MLYSELKKDLIELMHEATPMNLNSLVNTIRNCENVKTVRIRKFYMRGPISTDDFKNIYNNSYLEIVDIYDNEIGVIWYGRTDWLSPEYGEYRNGTPIGEDTTLFIDVKNDIINIISIDCEAEDEENIILFFELFKEL